MNKRYLVPTLVLFSTALILVFNLTPPPSPNIEPEPVDLVGNTLSDEDSRFQRVLEPRKFLFPEDHGPHNDYRIEWWYFTGNLEDDNSRKFGYELTFFRFALTPDSSIPTDSESVWRTNQLYMAHLALTDVAKNRFYTEERYSRAANGLAGARSDQYHVWLYDWSAKSEQKTDFPVRLRAKNVEISIDLLLRQIKPFVLQGRQGFSQKSKEPGNASYYYSNTRLETTGTLSIGNRTHHVSGVSWMDREWSTSALSPDQSGWDWFALQFSDQSELMYYQLRKKEGGIDPYSSGALFLSNLKKITLDHSQVSIEVLDHWTSPHSGIRYPAHWRLTIPDHDIDIEIIPLINDQELNLRFRYWEGAVSLKGTSAGIPVTGKGYVELTGYSKK